MSDQHEKPESADRSTSAPCYAKPYAEDIPRIFNVESSPVPTDQLDGVRFAFNIFKDVFYLLGIGTIEMSVRENDERTSLVSTRIVGSE